MEAVASIEKAPGVNPRPGRVPEQDLLTPKTRGFGDSGAQNRIWKNPLGVGFYH